MTDDSIPRKRCSKCGEKYPATSEYFHRRKDKLAAQCKACDQARTQRYYAEHKDAVRQRISKYAKANPEKIRAKNKRSYYKDHERSKAINRDKNKRREPKRRLWYLEHIDERKAYDKQYRDEHRDKIIKRGRDYHAQHPEKAQERYTKRRARELGADGHYTKADVETMLRTQKRKCWWCGKKIKGKQYHVDHRIPLTKGGTNWPENLVISCPECNRSKGNKLPSEWNGRLV